MLAITQLLLEVFLPQLQPLVYVTWVHLTMDQFKFAKVVAIVVKGVQELQPIVYSV